MLNRKTLLRDVSAGITGAVAGAPQAMGFALIAGVSPIYGLYGAVIATIIGAFTSGSSYLTIAPTNALALIVFSTFDGQDGPVLEKLFVLTLLVGVFQLIFGLLRLGDLTRFVSNAVMTGFITGAGLLIILGQLTYLNGYTSDVSGTIPRLIDWLLHLPQSHLPTFIIGLGTLFIIVYLAKTRFETIAVLTALVVSTIFLQIVGWQDVEVVRDIAPIAAGLPPLHFPDFQYAPGLLNAALAMAVLGLVQSAAITQSIEEVDGSQSDTNRDFVAQGLANIAGGLFQSLPAGGSLSRTAVNISAGARTRLANLLSGGIIALFLITLGPIIEQIALPALAAHLVVAAFSLIRPAEIKLVWHIGWSARVPMIATFISTFIFPLEYSIYVGVILSIALYAYTSSQFVEVVAMEVDAVGHFKEIPLPKKLPSHQPTVLAIYGSLYFVAVKKLEQMLPEVHDSESPVVILRLRHNLYMGSTAVKMLERYADQIRAAGGRMILAGVQPHIHEQLVETGAMEVLGSRNIIDAENELLASTFHALKEAGVWLNENGLDHPETSLTG